MARKSVAALATTRVVPLKHRPPPWPGLGERESEIWQDIVTSQAVDWFSPGDQPLLAAYCRAIALHERASLQAQDAPLTVVTENGAELVNPIFRVQDMAARQIASLAVKLRLAQSARYSEKKAATHHANANPKKPWE